MSWGIDPKASRGETPYLNKGFRGVELVYLICKKVLSKEVLNVLQRLNAKQSITDKLNISLKSILEHCPAF